MVHSTRLPLRLELWLSGESVGVVRYLQSLLYDLVVGVGNWPTPSGSMITVVPRRGSNNQTAAEQMSISLSNIIDSDAHGKNIYRKDIHALGSRVDLKSPPLVCYSIQL